MSRAEFSGKTKAQAYLRSGQCCEAEGALYGLGSGVRCGANLRRTGVEYDHIILDANSKDNSLENCAAVCPACHRFKTSHHDIPIAAKTVRQQRKDQGIRKAATMAGSRGTKWKRKMDGTVVPR